MTRRVSDRTRYRDRLTHLISHPPVVDDALGSATEVQAHWAKYACILISGYIEQSTKEILLGYADGTSARRVQKYLKATWPSSKNMKSSAISEILRSFDDTWETQFQTWVEHGERRKELNETIQWRNDIAHGKEANTNNVTLASVRTKFSVAKELVTFLEGLPRQ